MRNWKLKTILVLLALLAGVVPASAQTITNVTGTILDPAGIPYGGGAVNVTLVAPSGSASPFVTATSGPVIVPLPSSMNAAGFFSMNLVANASITPSSTTYTFRFCAPVVPPPLGSGNSCFTVTGITIAGASQDVSAAVNPSAVPLLNSSSTNRVYNTAPAAGTASIGATTMVTAPAQPAAGSNYTLNVYVTQTALGASCTGNTTIAVNAIFQDPNAASAQTVSIGTFTVTTNGTLGNVPLTSGAYAGEIFMHVKAGTVVQFSTTYTLGTACSPGPAVQVFPNLAVY